KRAGGDKVPLRPKVQFLTVILCEKSHAVSRMCSAQYGARKHRARAKERDKMDWKPKGGNRPTDHDLEVAVFEGPCAWHGGRNPSGGNVVLGVVGLHSRLVLDPLIVLDELGSDAIRQIGRHMIEHA